MSAPKRKAEPAPPPPVPVDPNRDPLEDYLDAILTAQSRENQLRYLRMMRDDVTSKVRGRAANLIQDALLVVRTLDTPPV